MVLLDVSCYNRRNKHVFAGCKYEHVNDYFCYIQRIKSTILLQKCLWTQRISI